MPFCTEYEIDYMLIRPTNLTSLTRLMQYCQETSIKHANRTNYDMAWYQTQQMGWMLLRWQVECYEYPAYEEKITIETSPSAFQSFIASRNFVMKNKKGNVLLRAISDWLLLDLKEKKPIRCGNEIARSYGNIEQSALPIQKLKPQMRDYSLIKTITYCLNPLDIDTNLHMNNNKYIEIAENLILEKDPSFHIEKMWVSYKHEISYPSKISVDMLQKENHYLFIFHQREITHAEVFITLLPSLQ